jgi:hypothetical protein
LIKSKLPKSNNVTFYKYLINNRLVALSLEYPMVEEDSEKKQNDKLNSLISIENLGNQEEIQIGDKRELEKIILGDFCITPKCKKCTSNVRKCEHKDKR